MVCGLLLLLLLFWTRRSTMRLCQRHRSTNCAICGRTPRCQTPGVPATPEPSMTKNSSSSRAHLALNVRMDGARKNACKTGEKKPTLPQYHEFEAPPTNSGNCWNLSLQDRRDVNSLSINCSCGTSTVFCTTTHDLLNNWQINNCVQELDTHVDDLHNRDIDHLVNALHNDGHVDSLVQELDHTHETATAEPSQFSAPSTRPCQRSALQNAGEPVLGEDLEDHRRPPRPATVKSSAAATATTARPPTPPRIDLPFLPLALPSALFPLPRLQEVHGKPAQLRQGGCGHH